MCIEYALYQRSAQVQLNGFLSLLSDYEVVPEEERRLYTQRVTDQISVRAAKISQFKKEKELRSKVEVRVRSALLISLLTNQHCRYYKDVAESRLNRMPQKVMA